MQRVPSLRAFDQLQLIFHGRVYDVTPFFCLASFSPWRKKKIRSGIAKLNNKTDMAQCFRHVTHTHHKTGINFYWWYFWQCVAPGAFGPIMAKEEVHSITLSAQYGNWYDKLGSVNLSVVSTNEHSG